MEDGLRRNENRREKWE